MKRYSTLEMALKIGCEKHFIYGLTRWNGRRKHNYPPAFPAKKPGECHYFDERDLEILKEYYLLKTQIEELEQKYFNRVRPIDFGRRIGGVVNAQV